MVIPDDKQQRGHCFNNQQCKFVNKLQTNKLNYSIFWVWLKYSGTPGHMPGQLIAILSGPSSELSETETLWCSSRDAGTDDRTVGSQDAAATSAGFIENFNSASIITRYSIYRTFCIEMVIIGLISACGWCLDVCCPRYLTTLMDEGPSTELSPLSTAINCAGEPRYILVRPYIFTTNYTNKPGPGRM